MKWIWRFVCVLFAACRRGSSLLPATDFALAHKYAECCQLHQQLTSFASCLAIGHIPMHFISIAKLLRLVLFI